MQQEAAGSPPGMPHQRGFTLFEIILALLILAIAIVPMMSAFTPALTSSNFGEERAVFSSQVRKTMNRIAGMDYRTLDANQANPVNLATLLGSAAEAAKEDLSYKGQTYSPVVSITDASGGAGGLLEVSVALGTVNLKTLKADR